MLSFICKCTKSSTCCWTDELCRLKIAVWMVGTSCGLDRFGLKEMMLGVASFLCNETAWFSEYS